MNQEKNIRVQFDLPVGEMEIRARAMHTHYVKHLAQFAQASPLFNEAWGQAFLAAIAALQAATFPNQAISQLAIATADVREAMEEGRERLRTLFI